MVAAAWVVVVVLGRDVCYAGGARLDCIDIQPPNLSALKTGICVSHGLPTLHV